MHCTFKKDKPLDGREGKRQEEMREGFRREIIRKQGALVTTYFIHNELTRNFMGSISNTDQVNRLQQEKNIQRKFGITCNTE